MPVRPASLRSRGRCRTKKPGVTVAEKAVKPAMSAKMMVTLSWLRTIKRRNPLTSRSICCSCSSATSLAGPTRRPKRRRDTQGAQSVCAAMATMRCPCHWAVMPAAARAMHAPSRQDRVQDQLGLLADGREGQLVGVQLPR